MRIALILLGVLFAGLSSARAEPASTRYGEEYKTCNQGNTAEIVQCVDGLYRRWDARLNGAYQKLMAKVPDPKIREALRKAQRLWVQYRRANCEWYDMGEGTIRRIEASECMRSMTAERALELEAEN